MYCGLDDIKSGISHSSGTCKSKVRGPSDLVFGEGSLLWLKMAVCHLAYSHSVQVERERVGKLAHHYLSLFFDLFVFVGKAEKRVHSPSGCDSLS